VKHHPYWMKRLQEDRLLPFMEDKDEKEYYRRQLLPPLYYLNGAVDVVWVENVLKEELLFTGDVRAYVMPPEFSEDIDTEFDFVIVEAILERRRV